MSVKIRMHDFWLHLVGNQPVVETEGNTIGECFDDLVRRYPGIKDELFDKRGKLHGYVEIYLNNASAYPNELKRPVKDGDEIMVVVMAVGG